MKSINLIIVTILLYALQSCSGQVISEGLTVDDFEAKLSTLKNEQLIDVRTPEEYEQGHLQNSALINFRLADFKDQLSKLDKDQPVMVYCAVGGRSNKTRLMLVEMGFKEIYELEGGFNAWKQAGKDY